MVSAVEFGGIRSDIELRHHMTPGESRPIRFRVKDGNGDDVESLDGYEFEWFIRRSQSDGHGLDQLRLNPIVHKENDDFTAAVPFASTSLTTDDLKNPGNYWHEFWRVDTGNRERLAYGDFLVIS